MSILSLYGKKDVKAPTKYGKSLVATEKKSKLTPQQSKVNKLAMSDLRKYNSKFDRETYTKYLG